MMRYLVVLFLIMSFPAMVLAASEGGVPYGDYSDWCSAYGICKESLGPKQAEKAIIVYFETKGLRAKNMRHRDRFIEADIYRENKMVDKILFDRKTGRMRSTY